jgi:hypothetical protein
MWHLWWACAGEAPPASLPSPVTVPAWDPPRGVQEHRVVRGEGAGAVARARGAP